MRKSAEEARLAERVRPHWYACIEMGHPGENNQPSLEVRVWLRGRSKARDGEKRSQQRKGSGHGKRESSTQVRVHQMQVGPRPLEYASKKPQRLARKPSNRELWVEERDCRRCAPNRDSQSQGVLSWVRGRHQEGRSRTPLCSVHQSSSYKGAPREQALETSQRPGS